MKTLLINAHPDFTNPQHFSNQLEERFLAAYRQRFAMDDLTILNLYENDIPRIEAGQLWSVWDKQSRDIVLTPQEKRAAKRAQHLLSQFMAHKRIVVVSPLHNFNVTSRMKDYIDNILIARQTFRYISTPDTNGKASVGLLTDDYRALLLIASGSLYTRHDYYDHLDFAPRYLQAMFQDVMGFSQFDLVRAEGTATLAPETVLNHALDHFQGAFTHFYRNDPMK